MGSGQRKFPLQALHYPYRKAYLQWNVRFIKFHNLRHPQNMGTPEVRVYLAFLAIKRHLAAFSQNQALNAIKSLNKEAIQKPFGEIENPVWAIKNLKLPVLLSKPEVKNLDVQLKDEYHKIAYLLYGVGMQLMEYIRLRRKDINFQ